MELTCYNRANLNLAGRQLRLGAIAIDSGVHEIIKKETMERNFEF